jgi:hypothetical protein
MTTKGEVLELIRSHESFSKSTKNSYSSRIRSVCKILGVEGDETDIVELLKDEVRVIEGLREHYKKEETIRATVNTLMTILRNLGIDEDGEIRNRYLMVKNESRPQKEVPKVNELMEKMEVLFGEFDELVNEMKDKEEYEMPRKMMESAKRIFMNHMKQFKVVYDMVEEEENKTNQKKHITIEEVYELINNDEELRPKTKENYRLALVSIMKNLPEVNDTSFLENEEEVIKMMNSRYENVGTRKAYFTVFFHIMNKIDLPKSERYITYFLGLKDKIDAVRKQNIKTERHFDWKELKDAYDKNKHLLKGELRLLGALYIERPPLRGEWIRYIYVTDDLSKYSNAIMEKDGEVFLKLEDYKNSKKMGVYEYQFPEGEMKNLVIEQMRRKGEDNVFIKMVLKTLEKKIEEIVRTLTGMEKIGIQELRRSYETFMQKSEEYMNANIMEQDKMHADLLHTANLAREYRRL